MYLPDSDRLCIGTNRNNNQTDNRNFNVHNTPRWLRWTGGVGKKKAFLFLYSNSNWPLTITKALRAWIVLTRNMNGKEKKLNHKGIRP